MSAFKASELACQCGCGKSDVSPILIHRLDALRLLWGKPMLVTSGIRCPEHNAKVGGAKNSAHCLGLAVDIADGSGLLYKFCSIELLEKVDLWIEADTKGWVHFQSRPAMRRIFAR